MTSGKIARVTVWLAKALLMLSLLSVLVWWRMGAGLFLAGCCVYALVGLLSGHLPRWLVTVKE